MNSSGVLGSQAAHVRQQIKLCALIVERRRRAAADAARCGFPSQAQQQDDIAALAAMFAAEIANQNRELLAA